MGKKDNGFLLFYDWKAPFAALSGDECKKILMAMFDYARDGTEPPEFEGMAQMAACFIFPAMKRRKESIENGRRGGQARVENAASGDGKGEGAEDYSNSTPLEPPLNPPSSPLDDMSNPPSSTKTRQDKDIDIDKDIDENKNIDYRQDDDEIKQSGCAADVSSVVSQAIEICKWMDVPSRITAKLHREVLTSGYTDEDFRLLFEEANRCEFLRGGGERGWKASLEWLVEHRDDVISGKYAAWNRADQSGDGSNSSFDTKEFFELALARSYRNVNTGENNDETT